MSKPKKSNYVTLYVCPECDGDGEAACAPCDDYGIWVCQTCNGEGLVTESVLERFNEDQEGG